MQGAALLTTNSSTTEIADIFTATLSFMFRPFFKLLLSGCELTLYKHFGFASSCGSCE